MTTAELIAEIERLDQAATPGPWRPGHLSKEGVSCDCTYVFAENDTEGCIAEVRYKTPADEWASEYPTKDEAAANQTLIAAFRTLAVEAAKKLRTMTAACEQAMEWIRADDADAAIYDILNDAISANPLADFGTKDAS